MLYSYGFDFGDARAATAADMALPKAPLLLPGNGSLVKSPTSATVWLISDNQKHGFVSAIVFSALGFNFSSVLIVTAPELDKLPQGPLLTNPAATHLNGVDVNEGGTIYWISNGKKYSYPSVQVYNSWHRDGDFSQVVLANQADKALPNGGILSTRVIN
jgi:hypothetical protein